NNGVASTSCRRNGEDQDEAAGSRVRDLVGGFLARSVPGSRSASGSLHKHEQPTNPTVSTFFSPPTPTIRVIGSPTVQPSPGTRQECTPVEQDIVGFIIGPTNLCDR